ncbi:unnamed protein product [Paramecium octaurelia]|uniref:EF-hand domain-containing protein n=1 Tax=Paramecium octaurelia TaxID=43137 RepID=A0A8S1UE35_PAROT|nr:unnamed protein product [Paramecium octaurelia]
MHELLTYRLSLIRNKNNFEDQLSLKEKMVIQAEINNCREISNPAYEWYQFLRINEYLQCSYIRLDIGINIPLLHLQIKANIIEADVRVDFNIFILIHLDNSNNLCNQAVKSCKIMRLENVKKTFILKPINFDDSRHQAFVYIDDHKESFHLLIILNYIYCVNLQTLSFSFGIQTSINILLSSDLICQDSKYYSQQQNYFQKLFHPIRVKLQLNCKHLDHLSSCFIINLENKKGLDLTYYLSKKDYSQIQIQMKWKNSSYPGRLNKTEIQGQFISFGFSADKTLQIKLFYIFDEDSNGTVDYKLLIVGLEVFKDDPQLKIEEQSAQTLKEFLFLIKMAPIKSVKKTLQQLKQNIINKNDKNQIKMVIVEIIE